MTNRIDGKASLSPAMLSEVLDWMDGWLRYGATISMARGCTGGTEVILSKGACSFARVEAESLPGALAELVRSHATVPGVKRLAPGECPECHGIGAHRAECGGAHEERQAKR